MKKENVKTTVLDISLIAMFVALITICSWISIPGPGGVVFTLQTFAIFATLGLLGGRRGTIAVLAFLLMGLVGIPVFAGFASGPSALFGTTGGYLIGFIFIALIYWTMEKFIKKDIVLFFSADVLGLIVCYAFGTAWFMYVYLSNNNELTLLTTLGWCVFPFILPDLAKMGLAGVLVWKLKKYVPTPAFSGKKKAS